MYNKLALVNACLIAIGNERVTDLTDPDTDTDIAITIVEEVTLDVLSTGWWFNHENGWSLPLDENGRCKMPTGVIDFRTSGTQRNANLVKRKGYIYDLNAHTFDLTQITNGGNVQLDMIMALDVEDCPLVAQHYMRARARTRFVQDLELSKDKIAKLAEDELTFLAALERQHYRNSKFNIYGQSKVQLVLGGMYGPNTMGGVDSVNPLGGGE